MNGIGGMKGAGPAHLPVSLPAVECHFWRQNTTEDQRPKTSIIQIDNAVMPF